MVDIENKLTDIMNVLTSFVREGTIPENGPYHNPMGIIKAYREAYQFSLTMEGDKKKNLVTSLRNIASKSYEKLTSEESDGGIKDAAKGILNFAVEKYRHIGIEGSDLERYRQILGKQPERSGWRTPIRKNYWDDDLPEFDDGDGNHPPKNGKGEQRKSTRNARRRSGRRRNGTKRPNAGKILDGLKSGINGITGKLRGIKLPNYRRSESRGRKHDKPGIINWLYNPLAGFGPRDADDFGPHTEAMGFAALYAITRMAGISPIHALPYAVTGSWFLGLERLVLSSKNIDDTGKTITTLFPAAIAGLGMLLANYYGINPLYGASAGLAAGLLGSSGLVRYKHWKKEGKDWKESIENALMETFVHNGINSVVTGLFTVLADYGLHQIPNIPIIGQYAAETSRGIENVLEYPLDLKAITNYKFIKEISAAYRLLINSIKYGAPAYLSSFLADRTYAEYLGDKANGIKNIISDTVKTVEIGAGLALLPYRIAALGVKKTVDLLKAAKDHSTKHATSY